MDQQTNKISSSYIKFKYSQLMDIKYGSTWIQQCTEMLLLQMFTLPVCSHIIYDISC